MINLLPSSQRHHEDFGWLDTHWHFSFSEYYDPGNMGWSVLRVFNDDIVHGGGGFPRHGHRDMEIVSYIIDGQLEHKDHIGNRVVLNPGEIQVMSAGKGILHSEYNPSPTRDVHFIQLWIEPRTRNLTPRWEQKTFETAQRRGRLLPVVSDGSIPGTLVIDQDAAVYISNLSPTQRVTHLSRAGRHAYLFVIHGALELNGSPMSTGDQARIANETELNITAREDSALILLDLP